MYVRVCVCVWKMKNSDHKYAFNKHTLFDILIIMMILIAIATVILVVVIVVTIVISKVMAIVRVVVVLVLIIVIAAIQICTPEVVLYASGVAYW